MVASKRFFYAWAVVCWESCIGSGCCIGNKHHLIIKHILTTMNANGQTLSPSQERTFSNLIVRKLCRSSRLEML